VPLGHREVVMVKFVILLVSWLIHKGITLLWRVATIVSVFNSNGQFVKKFGSQGKGNVQLSSPTGIGLLSNGNVIVCEGSNKRVSIFDSQGNFVRHICDGQLANPYNLFVDSDDNILVANDTSTTPVRVFKADGTLVKNISIAGHAGTGGVCMDPEGRIITIDHKNGRILVI